MRTILIYSRADVNKRGSLRSAALRIMGEQEKVREYRRDGSGRALGLSVTACLHMAMVYGLLQHNTVRSAIVPPQPLMVSFVAATETPRLVPPPVARPKPLEHRAVRHNQAAQPVVPKPLIAATAASPDSSTALPAPTSPHPALSSATPVAEPPNQPPSPAPAPVLTQPSFSADYLQNPAPRYPPLARRMRQEGKVVLRVLVDTGGGASQIEVRNSSGSDVLDEAALEAVKLWRFVPARRGDQPIAAWVLVPITFTLQG
jgi:protein TonB